MAPKWYNLMPSDDIRLKVGDRLVVLVNIDSLQRIEQGELLPRSWQVQIDKALTKDAIFEGARAIAQISGCGINTATELMSHSQEISDKLMCIQVA